MVVNDQKISSPEQLEKIVDKVLKGNEDDRYNRSKRFLPEWTYESICYRPG